MHSNSIWMEADSKTGPRDLVKGDMKPRAILKYSLSDPMIISSFYVSYISLDVVIIALHINLIRCSKPSENIITMNSIECEMVCNKMFHDVIRVRYHSNMVPYSLQQRALLTHVEEERCHVREFSSSCITTEFTRAASGRSCIHLKSCPQHCWNKTSNRWRWACYQYSQWRHFIWCNMNRKYPM